MRIAFLCGGLGICGGNYVIAQHAFFLQSQGHDITIITLFRKEDFDLTWHPALKSFHIVNIDHVLEEFDILFATWWRTAYHLSSIKAKKYAYFVQSIESRFHDERENKLMHYIDGTYFMGLPVITEAGWIKKHLEDKTTTDSIALVRNGIRKDIYTLNGGVISPRVPGKLRVLVEGPTDLFFKNVPRAIELCRQSEADEIWLLTSTELDSYPGVDKIFSRIPIEKTAEIYRSCDVLVKLSYVEGMFGPPLEIFHCGGTAIVYDVTGHDEYIKHNDNALVVQRDDEARVINFLNALKRDENLLNRLKEGAIATAQTWPSWEEASLLFAQVLADLPEQSTRNQNKLSVFGDYINYFYFLSNHPSFSFSDFEKLLRIKLKERPMLSKCVHLVLRLRRQLKALCKR